MSKTQDFSSAMKNKESKGIEITRQKSEIDEKKENSEKQNESETPKLECFSTPRYDEPKKNSDGLPPNLVKSQPASAATTPQQQQRQQQMQQSQAGECNLLPVLVERLRSALELSCSSHSSNDQLPLEDSGVDSEEDFRLWTSGFSGAPTILNDSQQQQDVLQKPKLDLKFLEDILLADIHTALARLQDTLKRVDIGTLTRYNASLDPPNKLYLLRLISNLLAKLKVPDDSNIKWTAPEGRFYTDSRRRKNGRHTINVSPEEIIQARRWFDEKNVRCNESSSRVDFEEENERIVEGVPSSSNDSEKTTKQTSVDKSIIEASMIYDKNTFNDKCMKDAINQEQLRQIKNSRELQKQSGKAYNLQEKAARRLNSLCKDDSAVDLRGRSTSSYYHQHPIVPTRYNKIIAKKSKIKRANTIDIPNYLQLKSDSPDQIQNGCFALRRPIDVGDRVINGYQKVVPSFEPKTDNDRKFLALINKNTDTSTINSNGPFKSFNLYQTTTTANKNWSSRFSNIKINFDKPHENKIELQKKTNKLNVPKKFENSKDDKAEKEETVMDSIKEPRALLKQKHNGFTHAPTSPFQKIEKPSTNLEFIPPLIKPGYMPKNNSMLQTKLKMFDQESIKKCSLQNNNVDSPLQTKVKFGKPSENIFNNSQTINKFAQIKKMSPELVENGHLNCYPFRKQFASFASGRSNSLDGKSNINFAKSKLLVNFNKDLDKPELKRDKPKAIYQESKFFFPNSGTNNSQNDFLKQYSYRKSFQGYPINTYQDLVNQENLQNYRLLEKKTQFNNSLGHFHTAVLENDNIKSEKLIKKPETLTQNVAIQTIHESIDKKPCEAELIKSIVDISREYPKIQQRKLQNNVSVQTSPGMTPIIQHANQNYNQNLITSNFILPTSYVSHIFKQQSTSPEITNIQNYYTRELATTSNCPMSESYYNSNYIPNHNYQQSNNYAYKSVPCQESHENYSLIKDILPCHRSNEQAYSVISQKLYNEFSKLPDNQMPCDSFGQDSKSDSLMYDSDIIFYKNMQLNDKRKMSSKPTTYLIKEKQSTDLVEENIQNQDISSDGIITRYTCAIATVSSMPKSPELMSEIQSPIPQRSCHPTVANTKEPQLQTFTEINVSIPTERKTEKNASLDEIQRHNMLQQSLIRRIQNEKQSNNKISSRRLSQEITHKENDSPTSPSFCNINYPGRLWTVRENNKAQQKINLFEEKKLNSQQIFRLLNVPPKVNVVSPTSVVCNEHSPIKNNSSSIDSSDEYLMSCANKPTRNIVLSKSESWHQLAIAKNAGTLQLPQYSNSTQLKPPKPKSRSSLKLSKQFEASSASDNVRKMEEKIQRYFQGTSSNSLVAESKQATKREIKSKRSIQSKKSMNTLTRSHTMPHLYDDKLFDENVDIDKAFDSIFKEATRCDNRH